MIAYDRSDQQALYYDATHSVQHPVFTTNLALGVRTAQRIYTLLVSHHSKTDHKETPFPIAEQATSIAILCDRAADDILHLNMEKIRDLIVPYMNDRRQGTSTHDYLVSFAEPLLRPHREIRYTGNEEVALARLLAAIHFITDNPLPLLNGDGHISERSCSECHNSHARRLTSHLPAFLARAASTGELDPGYDTRLASPGELGPLFGRPHTIHAGFVRYSWHITEAATSTTLARQLTTRGMATSYAENGRLSATEVAHTHEPIAKAHHWATLHENRTTEYLGIERYYDSRRDIRI